MTVTRRTAIGLVLVITWWGCSGDPGGQLDGGGNDLDAPPALADAPPGAPDAPPAGDPDAALEPTRVPILIAADNYAEYRDQLLDYRPFLVYAWATDPALENPNQYQRELDTLAAIDDDGVTELIMFSSYRTLQDKLAQPGHADYLRSLGVTGFGFNSEGFMTPSDEMNSLNSADPDSNAVARFTAIAEQYGFTVLWGPIRATADAVGDPALDTMFGAGLAGVGLQEQQYIESACVDARAAAVAQTATRYRQIASTEGIAAHIDVQIMPSRCLNGDAYAASHCGSAIENDYDHCAAFAAAILPDIDSLAIWASGPEDRAGLVPLIAALPRGD